MTIRRDKLASGNRDHVHEKDRSDQLVDDVLEIFSPRVCRRARSKGFRGGWSLDDSAMCFVTGKTWDLLNSQKKKVWNLFYKTRPKLLAASLPLLVQQQEAGHKFVFEHPTSASSWNFASLRLKFQTSVLSTPIAKNLQRDD